MKKDLFLICVFGIFIFNTSCDIHNKKNENLEEDSICVNRRNIYTIHSIKSVTKHEYKYKFGEIDLSDRVFKSHEVYDKKGNLIEYRWEDYYVVKYKYNDTIKTGSFTYNLDGSLNKSNSYFYDGEIRIDSVFDNNGIFSGRTVNVSDVLCNTNTVITYNKNGRISSKSILNSDSMGFYEHLYFDYGDHGVNSVITKRINNDMSKREYIETDLSSGVLLCKHVSYYNEKGQFLKFEKEFSDGRYLERKDVYDESGLLSRSVFSDIRGIPSREERFTYTAYTRQ